MTEYEKKCLTCKHNYKAEGDTPRCNCMCENHDMYEPMSYCDKVVNKGDLSMENLQEIISKVRQMFKFDTRVREIVTEPVSIRMEEKDNEIRIASIIFNYFGDSNLTVLPDCIKYYEKEKNDWETIITYTNFDELLSL